MDAYVALLATLKRADEMIDQASREELAECCRTLAMSVAEYRAKYGELPIENSLRMLKAEKLEDTQARLIADGMIILIEFLEAVREDSRAQGLH